MKTGRRAWRKWAKKQRYKTNRGLRRAGAVYRNDATRSWYKGQRAFFEGRPSVVVKPFTPRSLVGMTMGARKRRARAVAYIYIDEVTFVDVAERWANKRHARWFHQRGFPRHKDDLIAYQHVRAKYRIGQRLRPCPGCSLCKGVGCYACYPKFDQDCDACVDGLICLCDGSGVLPAKRSGVFG